MRRIYFLLAILMMSPAAAGASQQTYNFTVSNNTAMNFENSSYIVEIIEISRNMYVKVNMTSSSASRVNYLFELEPVTFGQVTLTSSSITETNARLMIDFPGSWGYPKISPIVRQVAPATSPDIIMTRTADKSTVNTGDVVSFTIKIENTGNATGYNLILNERLPSGFTIAPGTRYPPVLAEKIEVGESQELYYALKAVEPGTYNFEPAVIKYGQKNSKSNSLLITVNGAVQEKSNLTTSINIDRRNVFMEDPIKVDVKIMNTGKASAKSVLVDGTPPLGMQVIEGDFRMVYESIAPGEQKEYRVVLKATETGNYSINLRTVYNDNPVGASSVSEPITASANGIGYWYIILPVTSLMAVVVIFTIKRHREYEY